MTINFNVTPYYDDYNELEKYLKILFRPGYPVQARELTQIQSILQNQISRHGDHLFKPGAMVIPGQVSYDNKFTYVKVQELYNGIAVDTYIDEIVGYTLVGNTSGVKGKVVYVEKQTTNDPTTIYIKYVESGTDGIVKTFDNNEILTTEDAPTARAFTTALSDSIGVGSAASIQPGVYYINGFFMLVEEQTITLDKYSDLPSYRVGLKVTESIVTPEENNALLDNAQGTSNFAAPGAHRYKSTLTLEKRTIDTTDDKDFVEILRVFEGNIQYKVRTTDYSILEQTLARRTFDESGDYTVRNFGIDVRQHRDNNRGEWTAGTAYIAGDVVYYNNGSSTNYYTAITNGSSGQSAPVHTTNTETDGLGGVSWKYTENPIYNRGVFDPINNAGDEAKLAIGMEPGKAYVQGYEIEKIATEYVAVDKARDFARQQDAQIQADVGSFVYVTKLNNLPRPDQFGVVDIYDRLTATKGTAAGDKIGTARVRGIELESRGASRDLDVYKLQLFDVNVNAGVNFDRQVKQFYLYGGTTATNFTADIYPVQSALTGSVTASSSTTLTGNGTRFTSELRVGDAIYVGSSSIQRRVVTITNDTTIVVDSAVTATGAVVYLLSTFVAEPQNSALLFPCPYYAVRKLRSNDDITIGASYTVTQRFVQNASSPADAFGNVTITLNAIGSADTFASSADSDNYILVNNTTGEVVVPSTINVVAPSLRQVIFTVPGTNAGNQFIVLAAVRKTGVDAKEKTKTLIQSSVEVTSQSSATSLTVSLGKADGYRVISVKMDTGTFSTPTGTYGIDISNRYNFDNGQTDSFYDIASLILKQGFPVPTAPIKIEFEYFDHSTGDYFSVDSYEGSGIRYEEIPSYGNVSLRDIIDFRPRKDDTGVNFTSSGASLTQIPKRGIGFEADISYYLARKDKIAIDFNGNFFQVRGVPSLVPVEPEDPKNAMVLYKLTLSPYTFTTDSQSVVISSIDNKRYTMRDIGKLEKRIDNLEYYTSLSMLEQETVNMKITDEDGLDRFKNGFIVDAFNGHGVGDVASSDYMCSIDMEKNELRPFFRMDNVNLIEKNSTDAQRRANNYALTGDVITLPYDSVPMISQTAASRTENVNPFAIFTFLGSLTMNPSSDEWFEVDRRPDIVQNVEGNFNTIAALAEKAGVLGTVWNSWQNQWTGADQVLRTQIFTTANPQWGRGVWANARAENEWGATYLEFNDFNARFGAANVGAPARQVWLQTVANQVGQSRTGIKTSVVAKIDRETVEDKVLSSAVIPYIRSRAVLVQARGMKPNSRFYCLFDDINIDPYITPATKITFNTITGFGANFDYTTNVGSSATEEARRVNGDVTGDVQTALNRGDIIRGQTSGATAVVVNTELSNSTGARAVYVLNVKGTFVNNEVIVGSISGARGTINASVTVATQGQPVLSNFNGDVTVLFNIPNNNTTRFRTGIREFKFTDSASNNPTEQTSQGKIQYHAQGILQTKQATIKATRNAEFAREVVQESRTITTTSERVVGDTGWYDPLAQTFLVQQKGGAFLTKVDLFFATKDQNLPVSIELREVVNGYPGKRVLPFSRTALKPENVNLSTKSVTVNGSTYPAPDTPTSFVFSSPVYVQDATEYAIIVMSDSNNYRVWISNMGDKIPGTDRFISEQPYQGVFFKSQNATTWTADQMQDLTFVIHRAKFATGVNTNVEFVNDVLPNNLLQMNPFQTTAGTNKIRVFHPDHDMFAGSVVRIQGVPSGTYNNIPSTQLNATHTITDVDLDSYVIAVTNNADATGFIGGGDVFATDNVQYDSIQPIVQIQDFSDTSVDFLLTPTSGRSIDGNEIPYIRSSESVPVVINATNEFAYPQVIGSEVNETNMMSGNKSFTMTAVMSTNNDSVSPVIDTHRTSLICIHNKINNATPSNTNIPVLDYRIVSNINTNIEFTAHQLVTSNSTTKAEFLTLGIGRYLTIAGSGVSANNGTYLITGLAADGSSVTLDTTFTPAVAGPAITLTSADKYVSEIAPYDGSIHSKYITRQVNLAEPSTFVKVRFAVNLPLAAEVDVYYKLNRVGSTTNYGSEPFVLLNPPVAIPKSNNPTQFIDMEYEAKDLDQFDAITVKLVFRSTNSAQIPRIKDLRIIACA